MYILGEGNGTPLQYSCLENPMDGGAWWAAVHGVAKSRTRLSNFTFTFHFHALEKDMATHCSVLAWRIPGTGEPGGLPSMGLHRVGHDWSDLVGVAAYISISISIYIYIYLHTHTHTHSLWWFERDLLFMDRGAWQATVHGVTKSWTWLSDFHFQGGALWHYFS